LHYPFLRVFLCSQIEVNMSYIQVEQVSKSFGERILFEDISFSLEKGDKTALIAKNGTGKSTLLKMVCAQETCDTGQIVMSKDVRMRYLPQEPEFNPNLSVIDAVLEQCEPYREVISTYQNALDSGEEQAINDAITAMDAQQAWDMDSRLRQLLGNLDLHRTNQLVKELSGGERKRLAIATTFIDEPDFVILDEPTNHLDLQSIEWLEQYLSKSQVTLLMVTHDRYFLDRVCNQIIELDQKQMFAYAGNFDYFLDKRVERIETQRMQAEKAKSKLKQEQEWANRMPKARGTKAKYRLDGVEKLKDASRIQQDDELKIKTASQRLGKKVINLHHITKHYEGLKLINDFSYNFLKGEKVGIVGPNGAGKSTLLNIIANKIEPDNGDIEIGETISMAFYEQGGLEFDDQKLVIEVARDIAEVVVLGNGQTLAVERFLNQFLFPNEMHYQRVEKLSGGEKRRLYLLTVLMKNPNFLILDEPTNDLDIMTLNVLEEYLEAFQGTVIIVSHDRYFMDRIVDHIFVYKGNGEIKDFPGNYSQLREAQQLEEKKAKNLEKKAINKTEKPKQTKKKLSYKEERELEALDAELEKLNELKTTLEADLENPNSDPESITEKSKEYQSVLDQLEEKEMRWLELTELKEELENLKSKK
jgi:ATP-binding cassette subfamily F protein uup